MPPDGKWASVPSAVDVHRKLQFALFQLSAGHHSWKSTREADPKKTKTKKTEIIESAICNLPV